MLSNVKRISAALLALLLCSCSFGGGESSSTTPAAVSAATATDKKTDPPEEKLPVIKGFKGSSDETSFTLKWKSVKNADGYEITLSPAGMSDTETFFVSPDLAEYTVSDRKQGECDIFCVRAFKRNGTEHEYTARSKEIRLTTMRDKCVLTVQNVCQYSQPALPTGCECAALTSLLRHNGFDITKNELASDYLEKIPFTESKDGKKIYGADPNEAFPGDPNDENSYGCYSGPLVDAANKYLASQDTELRAKDLTGKKLSALYKYVNNGTPVVVWATNELKASKKTDTWYTSDGREITWLYNEHCLLLVGYDKEKKLVYCSDPSKRAVTPQSYDAVLFEKRYKEQGSHAIVVE